jgi:hypothetical protein
MSVVSVKRRLARLDHGESPEVRALEKLTDDELDVLIKVQLAEIEPALVAQWEKARERSETDENFSFLKAAHEIWQQADEILRSRA